MAKGIEELVITDQMRDDIKANLPKGYAAIVAEKCDCSEQTVYRVLNHKNPSDQVATTLIELARATKEKRFAAKQTAVQLSGNSEHELKQSIA